MIDNKDIDKEYCKSIIQKILDKAHKIPEKRKIKENIDGLQFACPITGDSTKSINEKRGHLYWDTMFYISYDDDGIKMSFTALCKEFDIEIDIDQRMCIYDHIKSNISLDVIENDIFYSKLDLAIGLEEMLSVLNSKKSDSPITNIEPIITGSRADRYLTKRGILKDYQQNIYQGVYRNGEYFEDIIIILNKSSNKIIGCQIRNLKDGYKRMFKIYNFEQISKWVYPNREVDEIEMIMYNKISYYFNILNVSFDRTITIFEGYIDSIFFQNSIGVTGVGTDMRILESNNLQIQYFFDNDAAGYKKTEEKLKEGYPVFLWKKLFEDIVNKKKSPDPYKLLHRINKVKDLNELSILVANPYKNLELDKFFSKDILDIKWIPKFKKKKKSDFDETDYNKKFKSIWS